MLIIGVVISFAALSIHRADISVEEEAERLAALIRLGAQEAVLQGRELAVEFDGDHYAFVAFDGDQWQPLEDEVLRPRTLPFDVAVDLEMQGDQLTLGTEAKSDPDRVAADDERAPPRIYLLSSGEMSPFEHRVHKSGATTGADSSVGDGRGEARMADHEWAWQANVSTTDDPDVLRLDVSAYPDKRSQTALADAVAYLSRPAPVTPGVTP